MVPTHGASLKLWLLLTTTPSDLRMRPRSEGTTSPSGMVAEEAACWCCAQVNLTVNGQVLVCASSWWNSAQMSQYLGEAHKPIWINLSSNRTELYREITQIYCGHSPNLERCAADAACGKVRQILQWSDANNFHADGRGCLLVETSLGLSISSTS